MYVNNLPEVIVMRKWKGRELNMQP